MILPPAIAHLPPASHLQHLCASISLLSCEYTHPGVIAGQAAATVGSKST